MRAAVSCSTRRMGGDCALAAEAASADGCDDSCSPPPRSCAGTTMAELRGAALPTAEAREARLGTETSADDTAGKRGSAAPRSPRGGSARAAAREPSSRGPGQLATAEPAPAEPETCAGHNAARRPTATAPAVAPSTAVEMLDGRELAMAPPRSRVSAARGAASGRRTRAGTAPLCAGSCCAGHACGSRAANPKRKLHRRAV